MRAMGAEYESPGLNAENEDCQRLCTEARETCESILIHAASFESASSGIVPTIGFL
jgi:hypothetical protein